MNVIMNKELVKETRYTRGRFVQVHCNSGTRIVTTEATFPGFGTVWFDDRCIVNILYLSKAESKYLVMYDNAEVKKIIMVIPDKEILFNEIRNGL